MMQYYSCAADDGKNIIRPGRARSVRLSEMQWRDKGDQEVEGR